MSQLGFNRLKQCRSGPMLYNINDLYVGRSFDLYGEFSHLESVLFKQLLRPGDVVLDIGANIGAHTVDFAQAVGDHGQVWACEPQRIVYQNLCANIALNSLTNVHCLHAAASDRPRTLYIPPVNYASTNNFGGFAPNSQAAPASEPVDGIQLDTLPLSGCRLMKVDVEGMEWLALKGALRLIDKYTPILYVENDRAENSADLIRQIDRLGYELHWHTPPLFNPDNFFKNTVNVFGKTISLNMLCTHRSQRGRLINFEPVQIPAVGDNAPQRPSF